MDQTENPAGLEENNKSSSGQEKEQQMSPSQSPRGRSRSPTPLSPPPANSSSLPQEQQQQSSIQNKQSESSSSHNHHHHHHHDESSKNFDKEMEGRSVFVRNLAFRVTKEDLQYELDKVQGVLDIYIPTEYHSKQPRGFAYIEFENAENAKEAQKILDGKDLKGRTVDAEIARGGRKSRDQMKHRYSKKSNRFGPYTRHSSPRRRRRSSRSFSRSPSRSRSRSPARRSRSISPPPKRNYRNNRRSMSPLPAPSSNNRYEKHSAPSKRHYGSASSSSSSSKRYPRNHSRSPSPVGPKM